MSAPLARVTGRKPVRWTTILGIILVPLTVAGVLLWGLWNPTERLDTVTAAVVNNDEPVELDGQLVPLGRLLAGSLIDGPPESEDGSKSGSESSAGGAAQDPEQNFTWILTDEDDAEAGLSDGRYATVVTIPENFSTAATSLSGEPKDAEQATIDIRESDRGRLIDTALSAAVTQTATQLLNTQLGEQFVGGVFVGMGEIRKGVGGAADGATALADGGKQLADGTEQLAEGTQQLSDGTQELASGAGQLSSGAGQLSGGAGALSGGAGALASGAGELAGGVTELAAGTGALSAGANDLSAGAGELAGGLRLFVDGDGTPDNPGLNGFAAGAQEAATGANALADGLAEYTGGVNALLGPILAGGGELKATLDGLTAGINDGTIPMPDEETKKEALAAIQRIQTELGAVGGKLQTLHDSGPVLAEGARAAATGAAGIAAGAQDLAGGAAGLAGGAETLAGGASELAGGVAGVSAGTSALAGGASELAGGASELAGGASELAGGASELATGASSLAAGTSELAASTPTLAEGAAELADGADKSAKGASSLAKGLGQAVSGIPNYSEAERDTLAETALAPVAAEGGSDELFNASGVPLFAGIALWAGALAAFLVLAPLWRRTREAARGVGAITLRSALPAIGLGAAQGAIAGIVLPIALGYGFGQGAGFFGLAVLAGVAFSLLVQGLSALFGGFGRFVAFALLVVAFAVGIVSTVPGPLAAIGDASPIGSALAGFQAIATGSVGAGGSAAVLALWGAGGLVLTALAVRRARAQAA